MLRRAPLVLCFSALTVAVAVSTVANAPRPGARLQQGPGMLLRDAPTPPQMRVQAFPEPTTLRTRRVVPDLSALGRSDTGESLRTPTPTVILNLFDDTTFEARLDRIDPAPGGFTWVGHVPGVAMSAVTLATVDGTLSGSIVMPAGVYSIRPLPGGAHEVRQVDQSQFLPELNPIPVSASSRGRATGQAQHMAYLDSAATVDVMVLYTPAAVAAAGGPSAMTALVNLGISETNTSYANSDITQRLRLVHSQEVSHTEHNDLTQDLYALSNYNGGPLATPVGTAAASLRNIYGADIVTLITAPPSPQGCGVAWLMTSVGQEFAEYAFNVVERSCVSPNYTFAHELGHNMGARHDWFVDNATSPHTYAHGYVAPEARWRTIMSYNNACAVQGFNCTRLLYWSNPAVMYNAMPMGVAGGTKASCPLGDVNNIDCDADDHRTLNDTALTVANFRQAVTLPPPVAAAIETTPSSLRFAATKAGPGGDLVSVTASQTVTVHVTGATTGWTVTVDQPWVQITGGTGNGDGQFTVAIVNPGNVLGGSTDVAATVTVSPAVGGAVPATVPVRLTVDLTAGVTTVPPFGQIDTPGQGAAGVVGTIGVTGWALDDVGVTGVRIYRNCLPFDTPSSCVVQHGANMVFIGDAAFLPGVRPDVEAAFPTYPAVYRAGWSYLMLTNMLPHVVGGHAYGGQGPLTLYAVATDAEGNTALLGRAYTEAVPTPTSIVLANDTINRPFGAIDTPGQGQIVNGWLAQFGWALTRDTDAVAGPDDILVPPDGSTMTVVIDGVAVGKVTYDQCRGTMGNPLPGGLYCDDDVANIFGNATPRPTFSTRAANDTAYRNLDAGRSAIGAFALDSTVLVNGLHTIAWAVTDSAGRTEGIGSRHFTVLNAGGEGRASASRPGSSSAVGTPVDAPPVVYGPASALGRLSVVGGGGFDVGGGGFDVGAGGFDVGAGGFDVGAGGFDVGAGFSRPLRARTGFDFGTPLDVVPADADGIHRVQLPELGRIELWLGPVDRGYLVANGGLRDLPLGSYLDPAAGVFSWMPPAGYFGTYRLAFIRDGEQVMVDVAVRPEREPGAGESQIRMHLDLPATGQTVGAAFTVAGWALDPQAAFGAGIGAVHVWAGPVFLGVAELGGARPDVARAFGPQFGAAGFGLTASLLPPGQHRITAYAWNRRTARWEDARTVTVTVR